MSLNDISPTIGVYPEIAAATSFLYSWLPDFTFVVNPHDATEVAAIAGTAGVEVHFPAVNWDHRAFVADVLLGSDRESAVVVVENKSRPRSRVRSYKGLFSQAGTIKRAQSLETEIPLQDPYSHFVGIALVENANVSECVAFLGDGTRAFAILSKTELSVDARLAAAVISAIPGLPGAASLNYAGLVARFVGSDAWLLRIAGYGRDGEATVQLFVPKQDISAAEELFRKTLTAAEL